MDFDFLSKPPFNLDRAARDWVKTTLAGLSPDDKLRQLFNLRSSGADAEAIAKDQAFRPGGVTRHPQPDPVLEREIIAGFNAAAQTPLLVSADLEGSRMSLPGGAEWPNPLALAAIDDLEVTEKVSRLMAAEARAIGINWSFTPVLDINAAFRSPIVATRGFGSNPETIARHAICQMQAFQAEGVASSIKHWPGEGFDDRDQHLLTTINPQSMEDWRANFGQLYKAAIDAGALSVMSAHIALPAYHAEQGRAEGVESYRPASIDRALNEDLLRGEMGFNGLIVSDATSMAGLGAWSHRAQHLPEIIENGCDVILFSNNPELDLTYLKAALADGRLSAARVDLALARQLALKAHLGLHLGTPLPAAIDQAAAQAYAQSIAYRAPTLVKDVQNLLPLRVETHKRVLVVSGGIVFPFMPDPLPFALPDMLAAKGYEITLCTPETEISRANFDVILYLHGEETLLVRGRIFFDWLKITGGLFGAMRRYWHEIPTLMVSFGYPYLLYDAPRIPTYINAYATTESMQQAVVDLLVGQHPFTGANPVDPFCGLPDAQF